MLTLLYVHHVLWLVLKIGGVIWGALIIAGFYRRVRPWTPADTTELLSHTTPGGYLWRIAYSYDMFIASFIPKSVLMETLSARFGRESVRGVVKFAPWRWFVQGMAAALNMIQERHCEGALVTTVAHAEHVSDVAYLALNRLEAQGGKER